MFTNINIVHVSFILNISLILVLKNFELYKPFQEFLTFLFYSTLFSSLVILNPIQRKCFFVHKEFYCYSHFVLVPPPKFLFFNTRNFESLFGSTNLPFVPLFSRLAHEMEFCIISHFYGFFFLFFFSHTSSNILVVLFSQIFCGACYFNPALLLQHKHSKTNTHEHSCW